MVPRDLQDCQGVERSDLATREFYENHASFFTEAVKALVHLSKDVILENLVADQDAPLVPEKSSVHW